LCFELLKLNLKLTVSTAFVAELAPFEDLIRYLYTEELPSEAGRSGAASEALVDLLRIADRFESSLCIDGCVRELLKAPVTLQRALLVLSLPETVKRSAAAARLVETVSQLIGWTFEEIATADSVADMSLASLERLLGASVGAGCEEVLFDCLLKWVRSGEVAEKRAQRFETLSALIKYPFMEAAFLEKEVASAAEMQTPKGQFYIQEARAFQAASPAKRKGMKTLRPSYQLETRDALKGSAEMRPQVTANEAGEYVVMSNSPSRNVRD
jgi:hypothetical protein